MFLIIGRSSWLEEGFRKEGNVFVARRALFGRRSALPTAQPFGDSSRAVRPGNSVGERLWTKCSYVVVVAASFVVFFSLPFRRFCARASAFRAGGENGGGSPILISLAIARKVLSEGGGGGGYVLVSPLSWPGSAPIVCNFVRARPGAHTGPSSFGSPHFCLVPLRASSGS